MFRAVCPPRRPYPADCAAFVENSALIFAKPTAPAPYRIPTDFPFHCPGRSPGGALRIETKRELDNLTKKEGIMFKLQNTTK